MFYTQPFLRTALTNAPAPCTRMIQPGSMTRRDGAGLRYGAPRRVASQTVICDQLHTCISSHVVITSCRVAALYLLSDCYKGQPFHLEDVSSTFGSITSRMRLPTRRLHLPRNILLYEHAGDLTTSRLWP